MQNPKYITKLEKVSELSDTEKTQLAPVTEQFVFRSNDYYQKLIDWNDPDDPIKQLIMPHVQEMDDWGKLDASGESDFTRAPGLEHKYASTALLLCSDVCAGYCRYCFRKRLFMNDNDEVAKDVSEGVQYISEHPEVSNVLLTGGDPLLLATRRLEDIFEKLCSIAHVKIIRIGSKIPAFNPFRILNDISLTGLFRKITDSGRKIYVMAHFDHPRELTSEAEDGIRSLQDSGVILTNQNPVIRGINDNPGLLSDMWNRLSFLGVTPYYLFQCRPTLGNAPFTIPIETALTIFETARCGLSGLAKRVRFVMSHNSGKIEIAGMTDKQIIFKYHSAVKPENEGRIMIFERNPLAYWLEDYTQLIDTCLMPSAALAEATA